MANSRLTSRASFFAEVDVLTASDGMPQRLWGQNLSESGIFLQTTKPYHPGDRISLRFDLDDNEVHVRAAEVVWVKPFEPISVDGTLPGIGVRFLSVDPPARAAIRRFVCAKEPPKVDSDVPTPPPEPELEEGYHSLASLKPLSLPPFEASGSERIGGQMSLPPDEPLPGEDTEHPLSGWRFEVMREDAPAPAPLAADEGEATSSPPPRASMPPLAVYVDEADTLPPFTVSLPPFELSGENALLDLPSLPPAHIYESPGAEPEALASIIVDERQLSAPSRPPQPAAPEPAPEPTPATPRRFEHTLPYGMRSFEESGPRGNLGLAFDDEEPTAGAKEPSPKVQASEKRTKAGVKAPPRPAPRTELPSEVVSAPTLLGTLPAPESRGPDVLELAAHKKVDDAFFAGKLSVMELPQAEGRGRDAGSSRKLRLAWAAGLLLAGGGLGVWLGYEPAPELVTAEASLPSGTTTPARTTLPAPKPVAEAEKGLLAAAPAPKKSAAPSTTSTAPSTASTAPPSVPFVSPSEVATSKSGKLPRKESAAAPTPAAPVVADSEPAAASPKSPTPSPGVKVEHGRVTVPLEGGRVARSFALAGPPRVVVDLVDADLKSQKPDELFKKGVARVRYGRPDPKHVRVVVELEGDKAPTDITTLKKGSTLAIAWR